MITNVKLNEEMRKKENEKKLFIYTKVDAGNSRVYSVPEKAGLPGTSKAEESEDDFDADEN